MPVTDHTLPVAEAILEKEAIVFHALERYPTGYCHQVYRVADGSSSQVLRISGPGAAGHHRGSLKWLPALEGLGVPVPQILRHGRYGEYLYTLITHLPGRDLGEVYATLSEGEKRELARELAAIGYRVSHLPPGEGYGYTSGHLHATWPAFLRAMLGRARERMEKNSVLSPAYCDLAALQIESLEDYLAAVPPLPFLDDTTTKNVLIQEGRLSGIVDVDGVCYGDPLLTVGLTNMALLSDRQNTSYIGYWLEEWGAGLRQRRAVALYTLLFCVEFMGEQGMAFDNGHHVPPDPQKTAQLEEIFRRLVERPVE